jgi:predicted transcriptional regulator
MSAHRKVNPSQVLNLVREGKHDKEIVKILGISRTRVSVIRRRAKLPLPKSKAIRLWTQEEEKFALDKARAGWKAKEIGKVLNRTPQAVIHYLHKKLQSWNFAHYKNFERKKFIWDNHLQTAKALAAHLGLTVNYVYAVKKARPKNWRGLTDYHQNKDQEDDKDAE